MTTGKGGYKIIDFKGAQITAGGDAVKIDGIYASLESNYLKPTLCENLTVDDTELQGVFVPFVLSGSNYTGSMLGYTITVSDTDMVTVTGALSAVYNVSGVKTAATATTTKK